MTARNESTGDWIKTKPATDQYRNNFDAIFKKKMDELKEKPKPDKL